MHAQNQNFSQRYILNLFTSKEHCSQGWSFICRSFDIAEFVCGLQWAPGMYFSRFLVQSDGSTHFFLSSCDVVSSDKFPKCSVDILFSSNTLFLCLNSLYKPSEL